MGNLFSSIFDRFFGDKEVRMLILGLDGAGKTTILYKLQAGEVVTTIPTIGFNVETVTYNGVKMQVWDLGGQSSIRPYWRCYYSGTAAVLFVVDSADEERLHVAKEELHAMLGEEELANAILLVLANKQDLPNALPVAQISSGLALDTIRDRTYAIYKCSATKGSGLFEGLNWLCEAIAAQKK